jgi:UDP-glucose 4-epimerase
MRWQARGGGIRDRPLSFANPAAAVVPVRFESLGAYTLNVLVTGGAGYIGSVSTRLLLDQGHDVVVFDNLERGHREAVDPRARLVEGDLRERESILATMKEVRPDAVMHFAAYAYVGESMEHPMMYFRNNLGGGLHLVEAMVAAGVKKIILSSTCATYGQPEVVPITEETPQKPENPYGETKLQLETILKWHQEQQGFQPVFLRYFNAAGASGDLGEDHTPESHLIPLILQVALGQREDIKIFGHDYPTPDGTCVRDYIHIEDLGQAHLLALTRDVSGAFNLGNGNGYSVKEVIEAARDVTDHSIPAKETPRRPGDPPFLIAAADKARTELGWLPKYPEIHTILEHAWQWHREHPQGYAH